MGTDTQLDLLKKDRKGQMDAGSTVALRLNDFFDVARFVFLNEFLE